MNKKGKLLPFIFYIMKVTLLLVYTMITFVNIALAKETNGQEILDKKITLSINKQGLKTILVSIERAAEIKFAYTEQTIPLDKKISVEAKEERLGDVLQRLFKPFNVSYEVSGHQIILKKNGFSVVIDADKMADDFKEVTGTVNSPSGIPIVGASVVVKGTTRGTTTNNEGRFEIDANEGEVLMISAVGYTASEITI